MSAQVDTPDTFISLFQSIGLSKSKAAEAAKNSKSATILRNLILSHDLASESDLLGEKRAVLIAALAVQLAKASNVDDAKQGHIVKAIRQEKLKSVDQVNGPSSSCHVLSPTIDGHCY
jgi:glutaminyl-tRNA synthetase